MYHFYIDETYKGERGHRLFAQGGLIVSEGDIPYVQKEFWDLKKRFGLERSDPVKWSPHENEPEYKKQRLIEDQNKFKLEVLKLITKLKVSLITSVIHESELDFTYDITFYQNNALDFIAKRFQYFLRAETKIRGDIYNPSGLIITDHPGSTRESEMSKHYSKIWHETASNDVKLCLMRETIFYSHCKSCCTLQLADFVVGATRMKAEDKTNHYFEIIRDRFRQDGGKIIGSGIVVFPSFSHLAKNFV
ncbi:MAG: DUF3800 domain-containing protein [Candidatus Zixiibacteriota bacterium]